MTSEYNQGRSVLRLVTTEVDPSRDENERRKSYGIRAGDALSLVLFLLFCGSAFVMVALWVTFLHGRMGWFGAVLGMLTIPLGSLFPFIHWLSEGVPSASYFTIWLAGVLAMVLTMSWAVGLRERVSGEQASD